MIVGVGPGARYALTKAIRAIALQAMNIIKAIFLK